MSVGEDKSVLILIFTGQPGEYITLGFRPVTKTGDDQEANVAIVMATAVKNRREVFAALAWDNPCAAPTFTAFGILGYSLSSVFMTKPARQPKSSPWTANQPKL